MFFFQYRSAKASLPYFFCHFCHLMGCLDCLLLSKLTQLCVSVVLFNYTTEMHNVGLILKVVFFNDTTEMHIVGLILKVENIQL